ncbi:cupredoxin domain-containing protein [Saccharomonospora iraqiensis]|uniref:cupredoxin domain-containing protein n=1 Tax=Saccharomonospora iraqiensis TaxID=52698 RepID=UPI00022E8969|nr:Ig-like domain repeat protein [Saccharomonospora iraqiensis]
MYPRPGMSAPAATRGGPARLAAHARRAAVTLLGVLVAALWLAPASATERTDDSGTTRGDAAAAQEQVLTWTADDRIDRYASAPETATAGTATIVFENSVDTGNTTGVAHTLTFDTTTPGYNHDVDLNIVASPFDANEGRHEAQVELTPGTYRYICDMPGHGQMTGELVVTESGDVDTTPPEVTAEVTGERDDDGAYVGPATVELTATDDSGVAGVEYELDDTGFRDYSEPVTVEEPGDHSVQYRATDTAGNTSSVGSVSFTVIEPAPGDTTPPEVSAEVTGEQDAGENYLDSATVTVTATDTDSGVASVEYALNDAPFTAYDNPVTVDEPGDHTVRYRATDEAGNTSQVGSVSFTVVEPPPEDTAPPEVGAEVNGEQDADGAYVGSATVTVTATDADSGVASVEYALGDGAFEPYADPIVVNAAGEHTVRYRASDNAGNTSQVSSVSFTVVEPAPEDTVPPEVSAEVTGERDADGAYVGSATVSVSATDADSGVAAVEYAVNDGEYRLYEGPVTLDRPGGYTVAFRATDNAENTASGDVSFTVVAGGDDACPDSDTRDTVVIGDHDTGVANVDTRNGCTINDLIDEDAGYANHGAFVDHVSTVADELAEAGIIEKRDKGRLVRAAARSDVGK